MTMPNVVYLLMTPAAAEYEDGPSTVETRVFTSLEHAKLGALYRFFGEVDPSTLSGGDPIEWTDEYGGAYSSRYQGEDMRIEPAMVENPRHAEGGPRHVEDVELIEPINQHIDRFVATVDVDGQPFHALQMARLSSVRRDGVEQRIILWLDPEPLNDSWQAEDVRIP